MRLSESTSRYPLVDQTEQLAGIGNKNFTTISEIIRNRQVSSAVDMIVSFTAVVLSAVEEEAIVKGNKLRVLKGQLKDDTGTINYVAWNPRKFSLKVGEKYDFIDVGSSVFGFKHEIKISAKSKVMLHSTVSNPPRITYRKPEPKKIQKKETATDKPKKTPVTPIIDVNLYNKLSDVKRNNNIGSFDWNSRELLIKEGIEKKDVYVIIDISTRFSSIIVKAAEKVNPDIDQIVKKISTKSYWSPNLIGNIIQTLIKIKRDDVCC